MTYKEYIGIFFYIFFSYISSMKIANKLKIMTIYLWSAIFFLISILTLIAIPKWLIMYFKYVLSLYIN